MRLQKLVTFGGLTVELFEDVHEVHTYSLCHYNVLRLHCF